MGSLYPMLPERVRQLVMITLAVSLLGGVGWAWLDLPVHAWVGLTPEALWGASSALPFVPALWQVVTYPFLVGDAWSLVVAVVLYGWIAGHLEDRWGSALFVERFWTLVLGVAAATVLTSLFVPALREHTLVGPTVLFEGLLVAWGFTFPERHVRVLFFVPVTGAQLAWLLIALLVFSAVFAGPSGFPFLVPYLASAGLGFVFGRTSFSSRWLALKIDERRVRRELDDLRRRPPRD